MCACVLVCTSMCATAAIVQIYTTSVYGDVCVLHRPYTNVCDWAVVYRASVLMCGKSHHQSLTLAKPKLTRQIHTLWIAYTYTRIDTHSHTHDWQYHQCVKQYHSHTSQNPFQKMYLFLCIAILKRLNCVFLLSLLWEWILVLVHYFAASNSPHFIFEVNF